MFILLFNIAGLATLGWALMILLPGWSVTKKIVDWSFFPTALCAIYLVGIVVLLSRTGLGVISEFGSPDGVIGLLTDPDVALIAWIHILAFDHLVAVIIFRDNQRRGVLPWPLQSILLLLTLMFAPVGFLIYWVLRMAKGHGPDVLGAAEGVP